MQESKEQVKFFCKTQSVKTVITALSSLLFNDKEQLALFQVADRHIRVTTEKSKSLGAKAYINRALFSTYELPGEHPPSALGSEDSFLEPSRAPLFHAEFCVNLPVLLRCLALLEKPNSLELTLRECDPALRILCACLFSCLSLFV